MSDPLDQIRSLAPTVEDQPELLERVRNQFMTFIDQDQLEQLDRELRSPRIRRWWAIPVAAALVATTVAAAFAYNLTSSDSTKLECPTGIYNAVTGDPIVDCSAEWRRAANTEPPAMAAFDNGNGGVSVLLANDPIPDGYIPLEPGPFQNTSLIKLEASLDYHGSGLSSGCYDEPAARTIARTELDRLGLTSWTITVDETRRRTAQRHAPTSSSGQTPRKSSSSACLRTRSAQIPMSDSAPIWPLNWRPPASESTKQLS